MKLFRATCILAAIAGASTLARAADCSGTVELVELQTLGCDGEATKMVSLAKCDYRSDKNPDVAISNVIDGRWGNQSVTLQSVSPGSFIVKIKPVASLNNEDVCRVERFDWTAQ